MVSDLEALLASSRSFCGLLPLVLVPHPLVAPGSWIVYWDGSYLLVGAGIGIIIGRMAAVPLVRVSVPVATADATRTKALGSAFVALLLNSWFTASLVSSFSDSWHVLHLLACTHCHADLFLYKSVELAHNLLHGWAYTVTWVPQHQNEVCNALAKSVAASRSIAVVVA